MSAKRAVPPPRTCPGRGRDLPIPGAHEPPQHALVPSVVRESAAPAGGTVQLARSARAPVDTVRPYRQEKPEPDLPETLRLAPNTTGYGAASAHAGSRSRVLRPRERPGPGPP